MSIYNIKFLKEVSNAMHTHIRMPAWYCHAVGLKALAVYSNKHLNI